MSTDTDVRQQLYDRIRESSRDEVILTEMIRHGFWPQAGEVPNDPADEIRRQQELAGELRSLVTEHARLSDVESLRREIRKRRLTESRRKREESRQRREQERRDRAAAWQQRKQREILYLGTGVSAGLNDHAVDADRLRRNRLPAISTPAELAAAMNLPVSELRFLAYHRRTSTTSHYVRFRMPKKSGGERLISAPMPRLKQAQDWILHTLLAPLPVHDCAHGFRPQRSIVTNAQPHVGADAVVNLDLEDFFPTVTFRRIKGLFNSFGFSWSVATVLALLCSEADVEEVELDGRRYFVALGERHLPQGAPTSPAITNLLCRGLDARLSHIAAELGFTYTRYADDLTFSGSGTAASETGRLLRRVRHTVGEEGFRVHPNKTRVLRQGSRQEVTGLVVNARTSVPRDLLRRFRATLYQIERDGPAGKHWGQTEDVVAAVEGFANYVAMVDTAKGRPLQQRAKAIVARYGYLRPPVVRPRWQDRAPAAETPTPLAKRPAEPSEQAEKKPWWKFW